MIRSECDREQQLMIAHMLIFLFIRVGYCWNTSHAFTMESAESGMRVFLRFLPLGAMAIPKKKFADSAA
jgi:hypothetical protein